MTKSRIIREAQPSDIADIMTVMDAAKKIMRQSGRYLGFFVLLQSESQGLSTDYLLYTKGTSPI